VTDCAARTVLRSVYVCERERKRAGECVFVREEVRGCVCESAMWQIAQRALRFELYTCVRAREHMCVCKRERASEREWENERKREREGERVCLFVKVLCGRLRSTHCASICIRACVRENKCVCEKGRERKRESERERERERGRESVCL